MYETLNEHTTLRLSQSPNRLATADLADTGQAGRREAGLDRGGHDWQLVATKL